MSNQFQSSFGEAGWYMLMLASAACGVLLMLQFVVLVDKSGALYSAIFLSGFFMYLWKERWLGTPLRRKLPGIVLSGLAIGILTVVMKLPFRM